MNSLEKRQQSKNTIRLSDIMDEKQFQNLLQQSSDSKYLQSQDLYELLNQSSTSSKIHASIQTQNNFHNKLNSNKKEELMQIYEKAYQRTFMGKNKLLNHSFFNTVSNNQQEKQNKDDENQEQDDYLKQYQKWKSQKETKDNTINTTSKNKLKSNTNIQMQSKKKLQMKQRNGNDNAFKTSEEKTVSKGENTNNSNPITSIEYVSIEAELKKIHQQYLSKFTQISKMVSENKKQTDQASGASQILSIQNSQINQNLRESSEMNQNNDQNSISKQINTYTHPQQDINQYCFINMIKNKPIPIKNTYKKQKQQNVINNFSSNHKDIEGQKSQISSFKETLKYDQLPIQRANSTNLVNKFFPQKDHSFSTYLPQQNKKQTQIQQSAPKIKLNINKLLSLGYKDFLIFFETNYKKILSLTTPQQYAKLQSYQINCLHHAEAVEKLRQKFTSQKGAQLLQKLSTQQKQKVFKILYQ